MLKDLKSIVVLAAIALAFQLSGYVWGNRDGSFKLQDPDCYMRLVRVQEFEKNGDWYDSRIPRSNAPHGETLHWTRPFDVLLLAGAKMLQPFFGFDRALLFWGIIVSPFLQFISALALVWAAGILFTDIQERLRLTILFLLQPAAFIPFIAGRPDHHSLLILFFIIEVGFLVRLLTEPTQRRAWILGALLAFSMWISVESLMVVAFCLSVLLLNWISREENSLAPIATTSMSLFLFSVLFLAMDKPQFLLVEYDRLSLVYIFAFSIHTLFWLALLSLERRHVLASSRWARALLTAIGGLIVLGVVADAFSHFIRGPYAQVNPRAIAVWLKGVKEVRPLFLWGHEPFYRVMIWLGPIFICLPFLIRRLLNTPRFTFRWHFWIFSSAGLSIFGILSFYQIRWVYYAMIILLIPFTYILNFSISKLPSWRFPFFALARAGLIMLFAAGFLVAGVLMMLSEKQESKKPSGSSTKICQYLQKKFATTQRIAAFIDIGPEILYRTPHEVIGTPYHRNGDGILFINDLMTAPTDDIAFAFIRQRSVNLILIDTASTYAALYQKDNTFCRRLVQNQPPPWLISLPLPDVLSSNFRLLKVVAE
ncbi:MAG: hypothetical protein ACOY3I_06450 [Verrucomicrobiota bacterium]